MSAIWSQFKIEFMVILTDGGMLMLPLTLLALTIYWVTFKLFFFFSEHRFYKIKREGLLKLLDNPQQAHPELQSIIEYTRESTIRSTQEIKDRFIEIHSCYLSDVDTRRTFLLILVTTAPLLGLLGTVMGMLTTFSGLAVSMGGSTVDQIAAGISEALITTQTGLIIAIPAYVMATFIQKRRNEMESCLTTLEALTIQQFEKSTHTGTAQ